MSQPKALYHWTGQIKRAFPNLSKPQARTLAAFSFGVATAQSCALNAADRALPFLGTPDTVEARLRRFISNPAAAWLCKQTEWPMGQVELIATTLVGSGRGGRRQRPHRDGGQGHRDVAELAESDRKTGHILHDARVEGRSRDDGRQKDISVLEFDGRAGGVLEKEGVLDRALGRAPSARTATMSRGVWRRIVLT